MGPRLVSLAAIVARRHGPAVAAGLIRGGQRWMADPANEAAARALREQLERLAAGAGDAAGRAAARLAQEVERRRVSVGAWERDLMSLRYEIADMAPGPVREAALAAYGAQARAGAHLVTSSPRPEDARRRVLRALGAEAGMLRRERLAAGERARALRAVEDARAAVAAAAPPGVART